MGAPVPPTACGANGPSTAVVLRWPEDIHSSKLRMEVERGPSIYHIGVSKNQEPLHEPTLVGLSVQGPHQNDPQFVYSYMDFLG